MGPPAARPLRPFEMLEAAIWIGVAFVGLALLAVIERVRSSAFMRAHGATIKAYLPMAALALLGFIAGSVAYLFVFLLFMAEIWQYALVIGAIIFLFLFVRIRRNWSDFARVASSGRVEQATPVDSGLYSRIVTVTLQAAGALVVLFMMLPVLTGCCLLYYLVTHIVGTSIANLLLAAAFLCLAAYAYSRLRAPATWDADGPE